MSHVVRVPPEWLASLKPGDVAAVRHRLSGERSGGVTESKPMRGHLDDLIAERDTMRGVLERMAEDCWDGNNIDGGWFQDTMVKAGLMVLVPASDEYREEWDSDTMYQLTWRVKP